MDFSLAQRDMIDAAFTTATQRAISLATCNGINDSEIRREAIAEFEAYQQAINAVGYFEKNDFTAEEQEAALQAAAAIRELEAQIESAHELTMTSLELDLADIVQRLALEEFNWILRGEWQSQRRTYRLPPEPNVPDDVCDSYTVSLFTLVQGNLNKRAETSKRISEEYHCLNRDDYSHLWLNGLVLRVGKSSAQIAVGEYISVQQLKQRSAALQAQANQAMGVGGLIWSVVGWDSPWDFVKDMGLTVLFSGSKIVRWGQRLDKARTRLKRAKKAARLLEQVAKDIEHIEQTARKVQKAASTIRKIKGISKLPGAIKAAAAKLDQYRDQVKLETDTGLRITRDFIRGTATSVFARAPGIQQRQSLGDTASREAARTAVREFLRARFAKRVEDIRSEVNLAGLLRRRPNVRQQILLTEYMGILFVQEFLSRLIVKVAHKETFNLKIGSDEGIAAFFSAIQQIMMDLQVIPQSVANETARWVVDTFRKVLVEIAQAILKPLLPL